MLKCDVDMEVKMEVKMAGGMIHLNGSVCTRDGMAQRCEFRKNGMAYCLAYFLEEIYKRKES